MSGESDEPHFALFFGFAQGFGRAVGANEQLGIVVESNAVNLPEIEVIGLQAVAATAPASASRDRRPDRACIPSSSGKPCRDGL